MTSLQPGVRVGPYTVGELIRLDSTGPLYRAHDAASGASFGLTPLPAGEGDIDGISRFEKAVRLLIRVRHPNLAAVVDFGVFDGTPYLILAGVPDGTLAELMADGKRLGEAPALRLLRGAAAGIDAAHRGGAVHGELRPEMIFIDGAGNPVVAGVGLARLLEPASAAPIATQYVSPEYVMCDVVGPAADVYALAALAYRLLAGRPPFDEQQPEALLYAHVHGRPRPPSEANPELPKELDAVLLRGLAKDPEERWPTCVNLIDALESALDAPGPVPQDPAPESVIAGNEPPPRRSQPARAIPTRLVIVCGLFALALALLVAIVILDRSWPSTWQALAHPA